MPRPISNWDRVAYATAYATSAKWAWKAADTPGGKASPLRPAVWFGPRRWWTKPQWQAWSGVFIAAFIAVVVFLYHDLLSAMYAYAILTFMFVGYTIRVWQYTNPRLAVVRRVRTRSLDRALEGGDGPYDAINAGIDLHQQAAIRRRDWLEKGRRRGGSMAFFQVDRHANLAMNVGVSLMLFALVATIFRKPGVPFLMLYGQFGYFALFIYASQRFAIVRRRLRLALETRHCPDCGYDLRGVPPAVPDRVDQTTGPASCPECGTRWPLIPGPTA